MGYWIAGYVAGMIIAAMLLAWSGESSDKQTPKQIAWCGLLVLCWPLTLGLCVPVYLYLFFNALSRRKRRSPT